MKSIFTISLYLSLSTITWSKTETTPMASMAIQIANSARSEFEATGEWPPMDKLVGFERSALQKGKPYILDRFNTFASIPGMPLLMADGSKIKYPGFHIYAISRIPNTDHANTPEEKREGGRFAVLFKEESGKDVDVQMPWIIESEAQTILQQIGGFDPKKAPFVFEDTYLKLGGNLEKLHQNNNAGTFDKRPRSPAESNSTGTSNGPSDIRIPWIVGVVILLIWAIWHVVRQRQKA